MGKGIDLAKDFAPEHAQAIDDLKDQLLIVLIKRLGGNVTLPVPEVDDTGGNMLSMRIQDNHALGCQELYFEVTKKN